MNWRLAAMVSAVEQHITHSQRTWGVFAPVTCELQAFGCLGDTAHCTPAHGREYTSEAYSIRRVSISIHTHTRTGKECNKYHPKPGPPYGCDWHRTLCSWCLARTRCIAYECELMNQQHSRLNNNNNKKQQKIVSHFRASQRRNNTQKRPHEAVAVSN